MIVRFSRPRAVLFAVSLAGAVALALALVPTAALAQQSNNNFFGNLFKPPGQVGQQQQGGYGQQGASPETDPGELTVRIDRLENQIRQLTGQIEQLQYRNQQLEGQVKRYEMELDYRGGAQPAPGGPAPTTTGGMPPARTPAAAGGGVPPIMTPPVGAPAPGRRSDAFDPNANPGAPGMPQQLGTTLPSPAAAPGGAPVDAGGPRPGGTQVATLPPTNSPKDLYDLAYGYVLRQEYAQAGESFRAFLEQYPSDRAAPDAYYWLGESDYLRQQYKEAAQSFLKVSTDYPNATKAPDALLRLGQSLAAIGETDAACATFNAIGNKYPRASANVRQAVEREQKRVRC
jgi:tol-pal system protein YbgF